MLRSDLLLWQSPANLLDSIRRDMEALFNRVFDGWEWSEPFAVSPRTEYSPRVESYNDGRTFHIKADLPGVDPKDVEIMVTGDQLTLKGERKAEQEIHNGNYCHREICYGRFVRTFRLPAGVKAEDIRAAYHHGVLDIAVPLPESLVAKQIPVQIESGEVRHQLAA